MSNRRITVLTFALGAFITLLLPMTASAQWNEPWWRRGDNRRDTGCSGYDRNLRDAIRRVEERSDNFQSSFDRALDRSRYDDSRREDNMNGVARQFRDAARRLRDRFNERDPYRAESDARNLLQTASRIDRFMQRQRLDSRAESDWNAMRGDLNYIARAYNYNYNDRYGDNDRRRDRRDDRRDRRDDRRDYPNNGGWRWPF